MLEYARVKRHVAAEMTLLCDLHQRERTAGLLPIEQVSAANTDPINVREGRSQPYGLQYSSGPVVISFGTNSFTAAPGAGDVSAIMIDGQSVLGFRLEDGRALLYMLIHDETNDCVLHIEDNELVYSSGVWDVEFVGTMLTIRESLGVFLIQISFEPPSAVRIVRGRFLLNGVDVVVDPKFLLVAGPEGRRALHRDCHSVNMRVGLAIGDHAESWPVAFSLMGFPRYTIAQHKDAIAWARAKVSASESAARDSVYNDYKADCWASPPPS